MTAYGTIPYHDLETQLDTARADADRWEVAAHALEEQLASTAYVLAQVCHHHGLIAGILPDDGRAAVAQLIADLGEDELVNLLITLPTGWADEITVADPANVTE